MHVHQHACTRHHVMAQAYGKGMATPRDAPRADALMWSAFSGSLWPLPHGCQLQQTSVYVRLFFVERSKTDARSLAPAVALM